MELQATERRVLGVLIEKSLSQPDNYPLTVNAIVTGSNQLSNRDPVMSLTDADALQALDGLRGKGLAAVLIREGGRAERWSHSGAEAFGLNERELAVLAELLLRGPQTEGELRAHISRMRPVESIEELNAILQSLMMRESPLVERMAREPGRRGIRFRHMLCVAGEGPAAGVAPPADAAAGGGDVAPRVEKLEADVASLREEIERLRHDLSFLHGAH
jgi:hypothetical protein